jgi:hypothetical protein
MTTKLCKVSECPKPANGCGLCHMHYWRLRHYGDVNHVKVLVREKCKVEDCDSPSRRRGWCGKHYRRWKLYGNPNTAIFVQERHGMTDSPEHQSWRAMRDRCRSSNKHSRRFYAGKGIEVCERWMKSFKAFYEDMGPSPGKGYTIDRVDGTKGYEPGNCRWATKSQQAINTGLYTNNTSGFRGVGKGNGAWVAYIDLSKKRYWLGTFKSPIEAAEAYNEATTKYHGADAKLNNISQVA